ncbi:MAG: hypothetical protein J0H94_14080 [Rhizobiales bacterium]|nr:hypothetical protein [Hyphomicrobiales bacterium]
MRFDSPDEVAGAPVPARATALSPGRPWARASQIAGDAAASGLPAATKAATARIAIASNGRPQHSTASIQASISAAEAKDAASIREHARRVGMPGDMIFPVLDTVLVRPDPQKTDAA